MKGETPEAKRRRLFTELAASPSVATQSKGKIIASVNDLSDFELRECYNIAKAAMAAQFEDRKITADVMEDFLKLVFDGWKSDNPAPKIDTLDRFPFADARRDCIGSVGEVILSKLCFFFSSFFLYAFYGSNNV